MARRKKQSKAKQRAKESRRKQQEARRRNRETRRILDDTPDEMLRKTTDELREDVKKLHDLYNRKRERLDRKEISNAATAIADRERFDKYNPDAADLGQLRRQYSKLKDWISRKDSDVSWAKKNREATKKWMDENGIDIKGNDEEDFDEFWDFFNKMLELEGNFAKKLLGGCANFAADLAKIYDPSLSMDDLINEGKRFFDERYEDMFDEHPEYFQ